MDDIEVREGCESTTPKFAIGQTVFVPQAHAHNRNYVPCPVCYGKRSVVVILGNGEHQPMLCDYCGKSIDGPQGRVSAYSPSSHIVEGRVTGVRCDSYRGWRVQVGHSEYEEKEVYIDRDLAEVRRAELFAQAEQDAKRCWETQFKDSRGKTGWSVGYHRSEIARCKRQIEYHESKLTAAKVAKVMDEVDAVIGALRDPTP
jgi:hypothetical protein